MLTPTEQQQKIVTFLTEQHQLTLCTGDIDTLWCASCFYVFDQETMSMIIMSDTHTRHGMLMQTQTSIAGTIAPITATITRIKGIQYRGQVKLLLDEEAQLARQHYYQRFPLAMALNAAVWRICLDEIKMTDNTLGFGHKLFWQRHP